MRKLLLLIVLVSCKPTPEFYIDGKPYYTHKECIESHQEPILITRFDANSKMTTTQVYFMTECDKYRIDTIEIIETKH